MSNNRSIAYTAFIALLGSCDLGMVAGSSEETPPGFAVTSSVPFRGVNLAGADFGEHDLPGTHGSSYIYPNLDEVDYFLGKGMTTIRLPFRWERLQRAEFTEFDAGELTRLDQVVSGATSRGAFVLLDPHNYARYHGRVIGSGISYDAFADFWRRLAILYRDNPRVIFGLMNEPKQMPTEQWVAGANAALAAIRSTGADNLVLVPGNAWTGAHSWYDSWYGTPNAVAMLDIRDPRDNFAFEIHQYLDGDNSGTHASCVDGTVGSRQLAAVTDWLREHGHKALLGEFAGGANDTCHAALRDMLRFVHQHPEQYLGWTYWAAGPAWGEYMFTIEPRDGQERPQLAVLAEFLVPGPPPDDPPPDDPPPDDPPDDPPPDDPPDDPPPDDPPAGGGELSLAWSYQGPIPGMHCVQIHESSDPHTWHDNYLCSPDDRGLRWSSEGPIGGMVCTQIEEGADPDTWLDNFLCSPNELGLRWSPEGPIAGMSCVQWLEPSDPHTWDDNYLCWPGADTPSDIPNPGAPSLSATVIETESWEGGRCIEVRLRNDGTRTTESWRVGLAAPNSTVTQTWNGIIEPGSSYSIASLSADWNRRIAPGGSVAFGLCLDHPPGAAVPTVTWTIAE